MIELYIKYVIADKKVSIKKKNKNQTSKTKISHAFVGIETSTPGFQIQ